MSGLHAISSPDAPWSTWTPAYTGFSANPSGGSSRFVVIGKVLIVVHNPNAGTSNATGFTITLPVTVVQTTGTFQWCRALNNGVDAAAPGMVELTSSTLLTIYRDGAGTAWTGSGSKNAKFTAIYELA